MFLNQLLLELQLPTHGWCSHSFHGRCVATPQLCWHRIMRPQVPSMKQLRTTDWGTFINILFWNLNSWDTASTLAGEVDNPTNTFPRALKWTLLGVTAIYVVPLLVATGICIPDIQPGTCQAHSVCGCLPEPAIHESVASCIRLSGMAHPWLKDKLSKFCASGRRSAKAKCLGCRRAGLLHAIWCEDGPVPNYATQPMVCVFGGVGPAVQVFEGPSVSQKAVISCLMNASLQM